MYMQRSDITPKGFQQLAIDTVQAVSVPDATRVLIQPENGDCRVRDDDIDPTSAAGLLVVNGSIYELETTGQLKIIGTAPGVTVNLNFYGA